MGLPLPVLAWFPPQIVQPKVDWDQVRYKQLIARRKRPVSCSWCHKVLRPTSKFTMVTVDGIEYVSCSKKTCATCVGFFATANVVRILKERQLEKKLLVTRYLSCEIVRRLLKESPNRPVEIKV